MLLLLSVLTAQAQVDFNLYFANNVGEVSRVSRLKDANSELIWKEVTDGTIMTNLAHMEPVKKMFGETRQKTQADQELFWKMRDDNLLCFRINDGKGTYGEFEARAASGAGRGRLMKNVSGYFFVNTNSQNDSIFITVNRKGCSANPADTLHFKYYVYDWGNKDLLVFKLDSRRRQSGLTYQIEYELENSTGSIVEKKTLDLTGNSFQSFYRPEDRALKDIFLVSNGNRLKLDKNRLMWGANLCDKLNRLWMNTNFTLDKHKNRELTIFNMLGSGLFEKYDTLFLQVLEAGGQPVKCVIDNQTKLAQGFTFNIAEVDANGKYVASGLPMKYVGCNPKTGTHKILTYGNPCYIEVFAPGCYPAVFKYAGAVDPATKELNQNRVNGKIRLIKGTPTATGPDMSNHQLYVLKDEHKTLIFDGKLHEVFAVDSFSMGVKPSSGFHFYIEDGGIQSKPKLLNGKSVTKYVEMAIEYSAPKSSGTTANSAQLRFEEVGAEGTSIQANVFTSKTLDGNDYPPFQRSYYQQRWDLVGVLPKVNTNYKPRLTIGTTVYNEMPMLRRGELNEEQVKDEGKKKATEYAFQKSGDYEFNGLNSLSFFGQLGKWNLTPEGIPGLSLSIVPYYDLVKGVFELDVNFSTLSDWSNGSGDSWRDNMRKNCNTSRFKLQEFPGGDNVPDYLNAELRQNASSAKIDKDHWAQAELDDIFKVERNKLGSGPFFEAYVGFGVKMYSNLITHDNDALGFYLKGFQIGGGIGVFYSHYFKPVKFSFFAFRASANVVAQAKITGGFKSFNFKKNGAIDHREYGGFFDVMLQAKAGMTASVGLNFDRSEDNQGGGNQGGGIIDDNNSENSDDSGGGLIINSPEIGHGALALAPRRADKKPTGGQWANRFVTVEAGVRGGGKLQFNFGVARPSSKESPDLGLSFIAMAAFEGFADIKLGPVFRFNPRITVRGAYFKAYPDDASNPTIPGYPNYVPNPKAPLWLMKRAQSITTFPIGTCIMEGLNHQASPFFTDEELFVIENGSNGSDLNNDQVAEYAIPEEGVKLEKDDGTVMTPEGHLVQSHHYDREVDCEMMVYEEMTHAVDAAALQGDDNLNKEMEQARHLQIASSHRSMNNGDWQHHVVAYDENLYDCSPKVAVNTWTVDNYTAVGGEDDEAACVWKRGQFVMPPFDEATATEEEKEEHRSMVEGGARAFEGDLMLSIFDGTKWSEPESILTLDKEDILSDYQIVMRNDTVLAAITVLPKDKDQLELRYYCKPYNEPVRYIATDQSRPVSFSLDLVGSMPTIAILNQLDPANSDIYVKEIDMMGNYKCYGTDLNIARHNPVSVKILVDKDNESPEDFAILWKCGDRAIHRNGTIITTDSTQTMLNCSRIFMRESMTPIPHITLACTADSTYMSGYSAYLDGLKVKVLYTLTDLRDGNTYLLKDEVEFGYNFKYAISYPADAMINADAVPVNLTVYNTGATPITHLEGALNEQGFSFDDIFINPYSTQTIPLEYELPENFDGLLKAHDVLAVFEDKWIIQKASRRRGAPVRRTLKSPDVATSYAAGNSDVRCELLGHTIDGTVNKVYLELTDFDGLNDNETVHVGLYTDRMADVPITSTAEVLLKANDFTLIGNDRKAYVELTVDGLQEAQDVEIRARVYNDKLLELIGDDEDVTDAVVDNLSWHENQHIITLLPSQLDDVTLLPVVETDELLHKVKVEQTELGVWISGLEESDYVRIFDAAGKPVYLQSHPSSRLFVPIQQHGVYLLSTGQEFVKFSF